MVLKLLWFGLMNMQIKIKDLEDDLTYYLIPNGSWSFISGNLLRYLLLQAGLHEETEIEVKGVLVEEGE